MMTYPRSHYREHSGNVTLYCQNSTGKVVWLKHKRYSEDHIANILSEAYELGRREALREVETAFKGIKP